MNKPTRHEWEEGSTHRSVAGKEYDEVWDYVARLEAENDKALELLEEGRDLILHMRSKLGEAGMWETILGRIEALLTEQDGECIHCGFDYRCPIHRTGARR